MWNARTIITAFLVLSISVGSISQAEVERAVPLEGVTNTRDLGGLKTEDGRTVRKGALIRSGAIDGIDADGMKRLDDMGVGAIVDLRSTSEATADPVLWPKGQGPERYNFPVMEKESAEIDEIRASIKAGTATAEETEALFYNAFGYIATDYSAEIRDLFDVLLANPEGEAVLFHCSGGKDRTGVATMLVLSALGVTRDEIEADFMMSTIQKDADNVAAETAAKVNAAKGTNMTAAAVWPTLGVRAEYLDQFYESIVESYGSISAYLHDGLSLTEADIEKLRDRYLE